MTMTSTTLKRCHGADGVTLVELLVVIAVVAILASLAAPSYQEFIASQRVKNASFEVMAMLTLTRSEAIKRNGSAILSGLGGGNLTVTAGGTVVQQREPFTNITLTCKAAGATVSCTDVAYASNGRLQTAVPAVEISSASSNRISCIKIDPSGTPSSKQGAC